MKKKKKNFGSHNIHDNNNISLGSGKVVHLI